MTSERELSLLRLIADEVEVIGNDPRSTPEQQRFALSLAEHFRDPQIIASILADNAKEPDNA